MIGKKLGKTMRQLFLTFSVTKKKKIYPACVSIHNSNREKQVIFLMIWNGEWWYYLAAKKLSPLLRRITSRRKKFRSIKKYAKQIFVKL